MICNSATTCYVADSYMCYELCCMLLYRLCISKSTLMPVMCGAMELWCMRYGAWDTNHSRDIIMWRYYCIRQYTTSPWIKCCTESHSVHDVPWLKPASLNCLLHSYTITYIVYVAHICAYFASGSQNGGWWVPPPSSSGLPQGNIPPHDPVLVGTGPIYRLASVGSLCKRKT